MSDKITGKVEATVRQELQTASRLAKDGAKSGAYLYPFKGIYYLLSHSELRKPLLKRLTPTLSLGAGITTFMFFFTYLPQLAVLVFTSGPIAALTTGLLVLSESSTLTMVLSKALLIESSLVDTFDGTLVARGEEALVAKERKVRSGSAGDAVARLGKLVGKPFAKFTPTAIVRYFMYLPLNFIPIVGTALFVALQGRRYGPNAHMRYFQLKGMSAGQKQQYIDEHKGAYTSFGIPAVLLEMVPIAGIFFAYTNTCGAALWAADMEQGSSDTDTTAPQLRDKAAKTQ